MRTQSKAAGALLAAARQRILSEYRRRSAEVPPDLYAPWRQEVLLARAGRVRKAAHLLKRLGQFPGRASRCLEIGCGESGWLPDLLAWGVLERNIFAVDLSLERLASVHHTLPAVRAIVGDGAAPPLREGTFDLIIASTVFSSILEGEVRAALAHAMARLLSPGGAALVYDIGIPNPRNSAVRPTSRQELSELFPQMKGAVVSLTLAPPLARALASWPAAFSLSLETLPFLRSHLLAVFVSDGRG